MNSVKRFFLIYGIVYFVVWALLMFFFGPPGMSGEFMEQYEADYDRYVTITKLDAYKLYEQRPELNQPAEGSILAQQVAFAEQFESMESFQTEMTRRNILRNSLDAFNALMVVVLMWRFGRKPLAKFLDEKIAVLRNKMDTAAKNLSEARKRRAEAQTKVDSLDEERRRIMAEGEKLHEQAIARVEETTQEVLAQIERDKESRKVEETHRAALQMKAELVDQAIDAVAAECKATLSPEREAASLDRFLEGLEKVQS